MNRLLTIALVGAALMSVMFLGRVETSRADGLCTDLCGCDCICTDCVCGDCCGCFCCDCGYMLPAHRARCYNWNGRYAHSAYGQPVALVIPPTANMQTNWGWGVGELARFAH